MHVTMSILSFALRIANQRFMKEMSKIVASVDSLVFVSMTKKEERKVNLTKMIAEKFLKRLEYELNIAWLK